MTIEKLADLLIDKKNPKLVNLKPIQSKLKNTIKKPDQAVAYLQKMPEKVRMTLDNIQKYLQKENIQIADFHKTLDKNKDGVIVMTEWVNQMKLLNIPGVDVADLGLTFDNLDINNDGELSLNEMSLFIKGVKLKQDQYR